MSKIALVTGANKGIGFETARRLGGIGFRVWLGARDAARGDAAAKALLDLGYDVQLLPIAVDDEESVRAAADRVVATNGKLDVLINNAGIAGTYADPLSESIDDIRRIYETNVFGAISVIRAFLPALKAAGRSNIVNVSSGLGSLAWMCDPQNPYYNANLLGYNSSKTALNAVTVSFAKALAAFGIRVNSVNPGYTRTDFTYGQGDRSAEEAAEVIVGIATTADDGPNADFIGDNGTLPW